MRRTRKIAEYTDDAENVEFAQQFLTDMERNRMPVPDDTLITLENSGDGVVCNICAGHKAKAALRRVIAILVSARYGTMVGLELDAYRMLLHLPSTPSAVRVADIRDILLSLDPDHLQGILRLAHKCTALFKWKLVQVAKKFSAIDPDAEYERISIQRLLDFFDNTVAQKEAYREILSDYMGIGTASMVVGQIRSGEIGVELSSRSLLGAGGLLSSWDQIPPPTADHAVLAILKRRLERDDVMLACMNCRSYKKEQRKNKKEPHGRFPGSGISRMPLCQNHGRMRRNG